MTSDVPSWLWAELWALTRFPEEIPESCHISTYPEASICQAFERVSHGAAPGGCTLGGAARDHAFGRHGRVHLSVVGMSAAGAHRGRALQPEPPSNLWEAGISVPKANGLEMA